MRGKTVYLQYSNRQEIVTSKNSGDVASNVLLVTIEGVEAGDVSIDVLHLVSDSSRVNWVGSVRLSEFAVERSGVVEYVVQVDEHVRAEVERRGRGRVRNV